MRRIRKKNNEKAEIKRMREDERERETHNGEEERAGLDDE